MKRKKIAQSVFVLSLIVVTNNILTMKKTPSINVKKAYKNIKKACTEIKKTYKNTKQAYTSLKKRESNIKKWFDNLKK